MLLKLRITGFFMQDIRMTIRLSQQDTHIIDMFVRSGEYATRSEYIRRAIKEYSRNHMDEIVRKTKAMKKLQDIVNDLEQIQDYSKK
jgi:Arc/MetJ-type ribon-helix-helix transcriptional regulator